jgi:Leucine-rich repeat (LRR) protein
MSKVDALTLTMVKVPMCLAGLLLLSIGIQARLHLTGGRTKILLELYHADRTTLIGPMLNNMVVDVAKTPGVNVKASTKSLLQKLLVSSVSFNVDDTFMATDNDVPYWMMNDLNNAWRPIPGNHTLTVRTYRRNQAKGRQVIATSVQLVVIDSSTKAPAAPFAAPTLTPPTEPTLTPPTTRTAPNPPVATDPVAPVSAPVAAPVAAPAATPVSSPIGATRTPNRAPMTIPSKVPTKFPSKAPGNTPLKAPTRMPAQPTRAPTRLPANAATKAPTKQPLSAPTPCLNDIVNYINNITLSKQVLTVSEDTLLDEALGQLILSNAKPGVQLSTCNETDRDRLRQRFAYLALIFSTGKGNEVSWFDDADECSWTGITCDSNGRVSTLVLFGRALKGSIPPDIGLWSSLKLFNVESNQLNGHLPAALGRWSGLTHFEVMLNQLVGSLPSSIGHWTLLEFFDVSDNKLTGSLPASFAAWSLLQTFSASSNRLTGRLPASIGNWTGIKNFGASSNQLTGSLPSSIGAWTGLGSFVVDANMMSGLLPKSIGEWSSVTTFYVSNNKFSGTVPDEFSKWVAIRYALFQGNMFKGRMPAFIGNRFCPKMFPNTNLWADCKDQIEIVCACCNICCDADGQNCVNTL